MPTDSQQLEQAEPLLPVDFVVKAVSKTGLRLPEAQGFSMKEGTVFVTNWMPMDGGGAYHRGLFFDIRVSATNHDDAILRAKHLVEIVEATLSFTAAASVAHADVLIVYAAADIGVVAEQFLELPVLAATRRTVPADTLRAFWQAIEDCPEDRRDRVLRAISWYRKALFEDLLLDRFAAFWTGLEALNPALQAKHGLPTDQVRRCALCGEDGCRSPIASGARHALERVGGEALWRTVHRARNELSHSFKPISAVVAAVQPITPDVGRALRLGILDLLEIPPEELESFDRVPMELPINYRWQVTLAIPDVTLDAIAPGPDFPGLRLTAVKVTRIEREGQAEEVIQPSMEPMNVVRLAVTAEALRIVTDPEGDASLTRTDPLVTRGASDSTKPSS